MDEHQGLGGSYEIGEDGVRRLAHRTSEVAEVAADTQTPPRPRRAATNINPDASASDKQEGE